METHALHSLEDTQALARRIANELRRGDVVGLSGDLGAGKTTFAQYLIQALSLDPVEVTSPTFTLVQTYPVTLADGDPCNLHHYDLYRIENPRALAELGLEEAAQELALIEWPDRLEDPTLLTRQLHFALHPDGTRHAEIHESIE